MYLINVFTSHKIMKSGYIYRIHNIFSLYAVISFPRAQTQQVDPTKVAKL